MAIRFPTAAELEQGFAVYEAEMQARRRNPLPPRPRDQDVREMPPQIFCDRCGKVFVCATEQAAKMLRGRHRKAAHPIEPGEAEMSMT